MLQISTGKFFANQAHETLRRAIFYTNYQCYRHDERIETKAGVLYPATGLRGLGALTCEITERIEKLAGGPYSGEITATSGDTLVNDFAALVSFAFEITCTPDLDLTHRLVASERPNLGTDLVPQKHVSRMFDRIVNKQPGDDAKLARFVSDLMALERKSYEAAIRAIRRYVIGTHRIADDVNLAYALFVMSIESLVQDFDGFVPVWPDYAEEKRREIDAALVGSPDDVADRVRAATLANEHVAVARRFREFAIDHVRRSFFREEAAGAVAPVSRPDLMIALRQAYSIRSGYVHHLEDIPRLIVGIEGFHETMTVGGSPTLTFAGLARLARHVIRTFVERRPKCESETFDWRRNLPGTLQMQAAPQYWIGRPETFDAKTAPQYLEAFLGIIVNRLSGGSDALPDLRPALSKIESLVPGIAKPDQRLPMLALYYLFNVSAPAELCSAGYPALVEAHEKDFDPPSTISLAVHLVTEQTPPWTLEATERLHERYYLERHHALSVGLGRILEAAFSLYLAEMNRLGGREDRARELIAFAVEACPKRPDLLAFEAALGAGTLPVLDWRQILLPKDLGKDATPSV